MHTPANWTVVSTGPARIPRIESDGIPVALMFQESAHHAALIAAAPALLGALRDLVACTPETYDNRHELRAAIDAISQATGGAA